MSLVGELLSSYGIPYKTIEGSLPSTQRVRVLNEFRRSDGPNILLMTLGTGAVGWVLPFIISTVKSCNANRRMISLNLAIASRIYLLEPQWNLSVESQAIGRAHRLGQTTQVVVVRYFMMNTIEEV